MSFIKPAAGADFLEVFLGCEISVSTSPPPLFFQKSRSKGGEVDSNIPDIFLDDEKRRNNLYAPSTNIKVHKPNTTILKKINVVLIISWRYESIILKNFKKKYPKIFKNQEWYALLPKIKKIN